MSSTPPRIVITGTTGQIGGAILKALSPPYEIFAPSRTELDLADEASIRKYIQQVRPHWIINPAAYTAVDKAESEPHLAHTINAEAPRTLGEEARKLDAAVIHFSTDYVFDGSSPCPYVEADPKAPLNIYGRTKLDGELGLQESGARHFILRTSWVYGATGKNFLLAILRLAAQRAATGEPLRIVDDQHGAPTSSNDLARLTSHILATAPARGVAGGTYHATASGATTWHGFACAALDRLQSSASGAGFQRPAAIPSSEFPTPARRPANSLLDCTRLRETLQFTFPLWSDSLDEVLTQLPSIRSLEQIVG